MAMALSYTTYTGDGTNKNFAVPFPYIAQSHVVVKVDNVAVTFTWLNSAMVQTAVAPANGASVEIRRVTPRVTPMVDFEDASTLTESDLDLYANQLLYIAQEAFDSLTAVVSPDETTNQNNAHNLRIVNVADPVDDQDAATKGWVNTNGASIVSAAVAAKNDAVTAKTGSETARDASIVAKDASVAAKDTAVTKAGEAAASATAAAGSATTATTKAGEAATSATNAATSESNALTYRNQADANAQAALSLLNQFKGSYYGALSADPTLDPLGNALGTGDAYWNTTVSALKIYNGSGWASYSPAVLINGTNVGRQINGLLPANNATTPNTTLDISPGNCRDKDQTVDLALTVGVSRTTAAWTDASSGGALFGSTVAANSGYHIFVVYNPTSGNTRIMFHASANPALPSGFTKSRRIGGFITDASANIVPAVWRADGSVELKKSIIAANARSLTLQSLLTLPLPLGVKLKFRCSALLHSSTAGNTIFYGIMRDPDLGALTLTTGAEWIEAFAQKPANNQWMGKVECWTNTSGQVYTWLYSGTGDTNCVIYVYMDGWLDLRDEFS
jgi:hypothetical protein